MCRHKLLRAVKALTDKGELPPGRTPEEQQVRSFAVVLPRAQAYKDTAAELAQKDPEALRQAIITDGHAPPEYRSDTVRNLDAWYAAFKVKPGDALYLAPADRVRVW